MTNEPTTEELRFQNYLRSLKVPDAIAAVSRMNDFLRDYSRHLATANSYNFTVGDIAVFTAGNSGVRYRGVITKFGPRMAYLTVAEFQNRASGTWLPTSGPLKYKVNPFLLTAE